MIWAIIHPHLVGGGVGEVFFGEGVSAISPLDSRDGCRCGLAGIGGSGYGRRI